MQSPLALNIPQQIFTLFYAIFWGTAANAQPRWKAFAWAHIFHYEGSWKRMSLSMILLNFLPICFFALVLRQLGGSAWQVTGWDRRGIAQVMASVIPAFAAFGFYRLWTSVVQRWTGFFYGTDADRQAFCPDLKMDDLDRKWAGGNFLVGFLYIVGPYIAAWLAPCIFSSW